MWRDLIDRHWHECLMTESVSDFLLERCEEELSLALPSSLESFYRQSNGLYSPDSQPVVMSIDEMVEVNVDLWLNDDYLEQYMPLEGLLFFSARADGQLFGFPVLGDIVREDRIYRWSKPTDNRILYADSLAQFLYKRWKEWQANEPAFWEQNRDCKDFDDYRFFLRLVV